MIFYNHCLKKELLISLHKILYKLVQIKEIPLSKEALSDITKMTLDKLSSSTTTPMKKAFHFHKKLKLTLIAATLLLGTTLLSANKLVNIHELFKDIFPNNSTNLEPNGLILGHCNTNQNIILTVEGLISNENTTHLIFNLHKEKGCPFTQDTYIGFDDISLTVTDTDNLSSPPLSS